MGQFDFPTLPGGATLTEVSSDRKLSRRVCSITDAMAIVGDRYSLLIVREIRYGNTRFQDIAAATGAPRDVLTARLRKLEAAGIIERRRYSDHPPRHEYLVTEAGNELHLVLHALKEWGDRHCNPGREPVVFSHVCGADPSAHRLRGVSRATATSPSRAVRTRPKRGSRSPSLAERGTAASQRAAPASPLASKEARTPRALGMWRTRRSRRPDSAGDLLTRLEGTGLDLVRLDATGPRPGRGRPQRHGAWPGAPGASAGLRDDGQHRRGGGSSRPPDPGGRRPRDRAGPRLRAAPTRRAALLRRSRPAPRGAPSAAAREPGAVQTNGRGAARAEQVVSIVDAGGLSIHLNPLQEAIQPKGEPHFGRALDGIAEAVELPVVVKEVGVPYARDRRLDPGRSPAACRLVVGTSTRSIVWITPLVARMSIAHRTSRGSCSEEVSSLRSRRPRGRRRRRSPSSAARRFCTFPRVELAARDDVVEQDVLDLTPDTLPVIVSSAACSVATASPMSGPAGRRPGRSARTP